MSLAAGETSLRDTFQMRLYGRDPAGRHYPVQRTYGGRYRGAPRSMPAKPALKLLLLLAAIIVIASLLHL